MWHVVYGRKNVPANQHDHLHVFLVNYKVCLNWIFNQGETDGKELNFAVLTMIGVSFWGVCNFFIRLL